MFKIIESSSKLVPSHFIVDHNALFQPGQIAQLKRASSGKIVCGVSDGTSCLGIIDDIKSDTDDSTHVTQRVTVWNIKGLVAETDQFCVEGFWYAKAPLYVDEDGKLTAMIQSAYLQPVAELINYNVEKHLLRFKWLRRK